MSAPGGTASRKSGPVLATRKGAAPPEPGANFNAEDDMANDTERPELLSWVDADKVRNPLWSPAVCSCGAVSLGDYVPERKVGDETHGIMVCYRPKGGAR